MSCEECDANRMTVMVFDCFTFFGEFDVLDIRLNVMRGVVDFFVIVEAAWTHTGKPKDFVFEKNRSRYAEFLDKIIYIKLDDEPKFPIEATGIEKAWIRENVQRNAILKGLVSANADDYVIISDLDEIADPDAVLSVVKSRTESIVALNMRQYCYYLNFRNASCPYWGVRPKILKHSVLMSLHSYVDLRPTLCAPRACNEIPSPSLMRMRNADKTILDGGWHFSYQGGMESMLKKLSSIVEGEVVIRSIGGREHIRENLLSLIRSGRGALGGRERFVAEPVGKNLPKYVVENQERFVHMLMETDECAYARTKFLRWYAPKVKGVYDLMIGFAIKITPRFLVPMAQRLRTVIGV